jgi:MFS family permease
MFGLGGAFMYIPILSAPSQWFLKKRSFAVGLAIGGAGIGGLVLSIPTEIMIANLGFRWTLRILAGIMLVIGLLCTFLIRTRHIMRRDSIFSKDVLQLVWTWKFFFLVGALSVFFFIEYVPVFLIPCKSCLILIDCASPPLIPPDP